MKLATIFRQVIPQSMLPFQGAEHDYFSILLEQLDQRRSKLPKEDRKLFDKTRRRLIEKYLEHQYFMAISRMEEEFMSTMISRIFNTKEQLKSIIEDSELDRIQFMDSIEHLAPDQRASAKKLYALLKRSSLELSEQLNEQMHELIEEYSVKILDSYSPKNG